MAKQKTQKIDGGSEFERRIGYSRAVSDGGYVFVSGTTGYDYVAGVIADSAPEQAEQCFANIQQALVAAGCDLDDCVRARYIFPDRDDFFACIPIIKKHMGGACPAATLIIAGLLDDKMKLEIEVTAKIPNNP